MNEAVLKAADDLFYNQGIAAVTMAHIRDTSGVSMRRLYSLYPSKSDLVSGWLEQRHIDWTSRIQADIAGAMDDGASAVDALFGALETWLVTSQFRGCGFINTYAERSGLTPEHEQIIRTHKASLDRYLQELVPTIPGLVVLVDGAIVQSAIFADLAPLRSAHQLAITLAGSLTETTAA